MTLLTRVREKLDLNYDNIDSNQRKARVKLKMDIIVWFLILVMFLELRTPLNRIKGA